MRLANQKDFATIMGVTPKTVSKWKKAGRLVMQGLMVDVEASKAQLKQLQKGGGSPVTSGGNRGYEGNSAVERLTGEEASAIEVRDGETLDDAADRMVGEIDLSMSYDEARRVKEVYLALLNQLEYEKRSGDVVDLTLARTTMFEYARGARDAWLNWPSKYAPYIASEFGIDSDKLLPVLEGFVHKQVRELGEPDGDAFVEERA